VFGSGPVGVILVHMRPADQTAWFPFALRLAATGKYTVLTFDFRGFGTSTGEKEFDHLDVDLDAAYRYMSEQLGVRKIFLVGASMGGTASLVVATRVSVAGVVSISSPAQFQTLDALRAVETRGVPRLFLASEDDVPAARSEEQFWAAAPDPKEQQVFTGNAHGTDILAGPHRAEVEQRVLDFLAAH
jgi:pimeloyl-ACP methyl ester carboxylesterase